MKPTTRTVSWLLICTALVGAACGDRNESHKSSVRKGTSGGAAGFEKLDTTLPAADDTLSGYWMQAPLTEKDVTRTLYWEIDPARKNLIASLLCEYNDQSDSTTSRESAKIKTNKVQMELQNRIEKLTTLKGKVATNPQIECQLVEEKGLLRYNLSKDQLQIVDKNNQPIRELCRATMDATTHRPVPSESCATPVTTTTPDSKTPSLPDATELKDLTSDESKAILDSEEVMSEKIKVENARWQHRLMTKKNIGSYLTMDLGKYNGKDIYYLTKTCYVIGDEAVTRVDIQVNPEALFTTKSIRVLEEKTFKSAAKDKKPECELTVSKKSMSYVYSDNQLTVKTERGEEVYTALPGTAKKSSPEK